MLGRLALDPQPQPARDQACKVGMGQCSVSAAQLHARGARTLGSRATGTRGDSARPPAGSRHTAGGQASGWLCWRLGSAGGPVWFESQRATRGSGSVLSRWISSLWIMSVYRATLLTGVVHGKLVQRGPAT